MARDIVIVGMARTAIGSFGGALKDVPLTRLATVAVKAALTRSGAALDAIGHVVIGNVIPTEPNDAYLSRFAALEAGLPIETPAFNVNRLCGSGLQAIVSAAQAIALERRRPRDRRRCRIDEPRTADPERLALGHPHGRRVPGRLHAGDPARSRTRTIWA